MKKILALFIVISMLSSFSVAYGFEGTGEEVTGEIMAGSVPEEIPAVSGDLKDLGDSLVAGGEEAKPGVTTSVSGDLQSEGTKTEEVVAEVKPEEVKPEEVKPEEVKPEDKKGEVIPLPTISVGNGIFGNAPFETTEYISLEFIGGFEINAPEKILKGTPVLFKNTGKTDLVIKAEKCKHMNENTPTVVKPDTFDNWSNLSQEETKNNIALGFRIKNGEGVELAEYWFDNEDSQVAEIIYTVKSGENITVEIIGKNGMSWASECTLDYDCSIGIEVVLQECLPVAIPEIIQAEIKPEEPVLDSDTVKDVIEAPTKPTETLPVEKPTEQPSDKPVVNDDKEQDKDEAPTVPKEEEAEEAEKPADKGKDESASTIDKQGNKETPTPKNEEVL